MALDAFAIVGIVVAVIVFLILVWYFSDIARGVDDIEGGGFRKKIHRIKNKSKNKNKK